MAGTQKKSGPVDVAPEDAPKLEDVTPEDKFTVEDAQAAEAGRTEDTSKSDEPAKPAQIVINSVDDKFSVTIDKTGTPRAEDVEVREGEPDPTLIEIPGLGAFRNGTTSEVTGQQLFTFVNHLQVTGLAEAALPAGVTIKEGGN